MLAQCAGLHHTPETGLAVVCRDSHEVCLPLLYSEPALPQSSLQHETSCVYYPDDVIKTASNEAYHTVKGGQGEGDAVYEMLPDPPSVPPSTSHPSQTTAGDSK